MVKIEVLTADNRAEYEEFLLLDPSSLIYSTIEYRNFLERAVGGFPEYYLARDEFGGIVGALPTFQYNSPGVGRVINSLPWYGSHGGCIVKPGAPKGVREALLTQFIERATSCEVLSASVILSPFEVKEKDIYESLIKPTTIELRIGQITSLPTSNLNVETELEAVFSQKTRNLVRKSRKQGFVLLRDNSDQAWDFLFRIHHENMNAIGGRAKPRSHFDELRNSIPIACQQLIIAMLGDEPVAALLLLYFNKTVEYFTPVIQQQYRSMQPLSFLIWHGMLDAIARGYRWWNWGGTWISQKSLYHFKAGWGAIDMPYSYLIYSSPKSRQCLFQNKQQLADLFPYYYVYPFDQL